MNRRIVGGGLALLGCIGLCVWLATRQEEPLVQEIQSQSALQEQTRKIPDVAPSAAASRVEPEPASPPVASVWLEPRAGNENLAPSVKDLVTMLGSSDSQEVLLAAQGLATIGNPEAIDSIVEAIRRCADEELRRRMVEAACRMADNGGTEKLFQLVEVEKDPLLVELGQRTLANMPGDSVLLETVARYRLSEDEAIRDTLLGVIRHEGDPGAVRVLCPLADQAAGDYAAPLGLATIDALGTIGNTQAVSYLLSCMSTAKTAGPVVESISRVGNAESLPMLLDVASDTTCPYGQDGRIAAVRALGNFATDDAKATLELLVETDESVRPQAEFALRRARGEYISDFTAHE